MTGQELIQAVREWREDYFLNGEHCVLLDGLIERLSALQDENAELRATLSHVVAERDEYKLALRLSIEAHSVDQRQIDRLTRHYLRQARGAQGEV